MILTTPVTIPSISEIQARQLYCPDGGDVHFEVAFCLDGAEIKVRRLNVIARDAGPSQGVTINQDRTSTEDAFMTQNTAPIPDAALQLQAALRTGTDSDSSMEAMLEKAIVLGLVVVS